MLQLQTTLLVWIAVGAFQATLSSKFYDTSVPGHGSPSFPGTPCTSGQASPCFPGTPCTSEQAFHPAQNQQRRPAYPASSTKFSYENSSSKDPCINNFVSTFVKAVQSSKVLSELFGFFSHTSAIEFSNGKYPEVLEALTEIGAPNPEFASQQAVESIAESFDTLTSDIVIHVYANSIAKYIFTQGILTPQNAAQLAKKYADAMEEAASCNDSEYAALKEGYVNFLNSLDLFSPDKALLIALQYANEWKLAAKPTRRG
ncbi:unnamed protein product [Larinioides sclopetarius]|uniref:Uncharacterized protein n=1 Tax=Larinioides sclopetarius TaxID=280406 RepID=A0AAV1Z1Q9_9ARAC